MCLLYDGSTRRLTESGFMEKPGIEPATPGLQGIALIHYTTGASLSRNYTAAATLKKIIYYIIYNYDFSNIYELTELTPFILISSEISFFSYR